MVVIDKTKKEESNEPQKSVLTTVNSLDIAKRSYQSLEKLLKGPYMGPEDELLKENLRGFISTLNDNAKISFPVFSSNSTGLYEGNTKIENILKLIAPTYPQGLHFKLQKTLVSTDGKRAVFLISDSGKQNTNDGPIDYKNSVALAFQVDKNGKISEMAEYWGRPGNWKRATSTNNNSKNYVEERFPSFSAVTDKNLISDVNKILKNTLDIANSNKTDTNQKTNGEFSLTEECKINPPFTRGKFPTTDAVALNSKNESLSNRIRNLFEDQLSTDKISIDTEKSHITRSGNFIAVELKYTVNNQPLDESRCLLFELNKKNEIIRIDAYRGRVGHF